jgi:hypothetical protein
MVPPTMCRNPNAGFGTILVKAIPTARLKSGADTPNERGPSSARRDFRPTEPWASIDFGRPRPATHWVADLSAAPLQFRCDDLLEFDNVSREFADTFRQFLGSHRFLVQRETECFFVE